jgi:acyl dehydratase
MARATGDGRDEERPTSWNTLLAAVGSDLGVSQPQLLDQRMVDVHAETTGDAQWIHNDPERARAESPFGGPIVQGFLLLSILTRHSASLTFPDIGPVSMMVNYGLDRVRFLRPVPVGSTVRVRATLGEARPKDDARAVLAVDLVIEVVDGDDEGTGAAPVDEIAPAVAARWLFLAVR